MRIFKFGGASIKDAEGIKNVAEILKSISSKELVVIISAMGKMTNAFEEVVWNVCNLSKELINSIRFIQEYHKKIINSLYKNPRRIEGKLNKLYLELDQKIESLYGKEYDFIYDQIVCYGELISTTIVSDYLNEVGVKNQWQDVRSFIKTDSTFRDSKVDWKVTEALIHQNISKNKLTITQGFLGSNTNNETTTLGREGSDYTAGIFAYCLDAKDVTIWKDVKGVLNADPRVFENTTLLQQISYEETIEMAFYGASVIHPKTIQPLQKKEIPLWVKSFKEPKSLGTKVSRGVALNPMNPCYIVKKNQILVSISTKDFSFIMEDNISQIFRLLHHYQLKVSLIQNSAISFSVCLDNKFNQFDAFLKEINSLYKVNFNKGVDLYTIRHFDEKSMMEISSKGKSLLSQTTQETKQVVIMPFGN